MHRYLNVAARLITVGTLATVVYAADPPAPTMSEPPLATAVTPTEHVIKVEIGFEPWPLEEAPPTETPLAPPAVAAFPVPQPSPAPTATVTPPVMVPAPMPTMIPDYVPPTPTAPSLGQPIITHPTLPDGTKPAPLTLQALERMALNRVAPAKSAILTMSSGSTIVQASNEVVDLPNMPNGFVDLVSLTATQSPTGASKAQPLMTPAQVDKLTLQYRLINNVRLRYYHLLALERLITVREELAGMTKDAVTAIEAMNAAGHATKAELLQAKIEAREQAGALHTAQAVHQAVWQRMAAIVGQPDLPVGTVGGDLQQCCAMPGFDAAWAHLLEASPELHVARSQVALRQAGVRQNQKTASDKPADGVFGQAFARMGSSSTNDQQIKQATWNELAKWEAEIGRVEGSLRQRLGDAYGRYNQAKNVADVYQSQNLPDAKEAYELSVLAYRQGQGSWPQVQIAQRNYFRMVTEHVEALAELRRSELTVLGLLLDMPEESPAASQVKQAGMR
jgi:outer membrane protein TolC